jgi:hypothetical protein
MTDGFDVPVTVAVNCCCVPTATCILEGEMLTTTMGKIVTAALTFFVVSATEVAVTLTVAGVGTAAGAV